MSFVCSTVSWSLDSGGRVGDAVARGDCTVKGETRAPSGEVDGDGLAGPVAGRPQAVKETNPVSAKAMALNQ